MMRPIQMARDAWLKMNPGGDFAALVAGYLAGGFVYSGDDAFILAMPQDNQWFIHLAAGELRRFPALAPYPLPTVAWQRRGHGRVRQYAWQTFNRHVNRT